jgi:hypothetical protein
VAHRGLVLLDAERGSLRFGNCWGDSDLLGVLVLFVVELRFSFDEGEQISGLGLCVRSVFLEVLVLEGAFEVVMLHFVEAVHVELPHKAVDFFVPEIPRQHDLLELDDILDYELQAIGGPVHYLLVLLDLNKRGLTPRI